MSNRPIKQTPELRQSGIGGSDVAAIMGLSPYRSPIDIYLEKIGAAAPVEDNDAMWFGREAEALAAKFFTRKTGLKVKPVKGTIRHAQFPYLMAHPDRLVGADEGLEIKTAGWQQAQQWGDEGSDEIPDHYLAQVHWYNVLCDLKGSHVALLVGRDLRLYYVARHDEWDKALIYTAVAFWTEHVVPRVLPEPPEWNALAQTAMRRAFPVVDPSTVIVADEEIQALVTEQSALKMEAKHIADDLKGIDAQLRRVAENFEYVLLPNGRCLHKIAVAGAQVPSYYREPYTYLRDVKAPRGLHVPDLKLTQQEKTDGE